MKIQSELVKYLLIIKHEKEVERLSRHNDLWSVPFVGESNRLIGFVYEADQNKIKEAQDRVDELRHQETLDKIDEAIDAIEDNKKNDNVYDYEGNQVIKDFGSVNVQALYGHIRIAEFNHFQERTTEYGSIEPNRRNRQSPCYFYFWGFLFKRGK